MTINISQLEPSISHRLLAPLAPHSDLYFPGTIGFNWSSVQLKSISPNSWEETIERFLESDPSAASRPGDNVMVVIGGIGTGKTTTVLRSFERVFSRPRECSIADTLGGACPIRPRFLHLDLISNDPVDRRNDTLADEVEKFWNQVAAVVSDGLPADLTIEEEVTSFWLWCYDSKLLLSHFGRLVRIINALVPKIRTAMGATDGVPNLSPDEALSQLIEAREKFIRKSHAKDLAWYEVLRVAYVLRSSRHPCRCNYLFLDNIDHADPHIQSLAVTFVLRVSPVLAARTIIAIRPLTWERSAQLHLLERAHDHYSPDVADTVSSRVRRAVDSLRITPEQRHAVLELVDLLTSSQRSHLLREIFVATSGLSVRFALRNFSHLLSSDVFSQIDYRTTSPLGSLRVSDLIRAYFCGPNEAMRLTAFDNLYRVRGEGGPSTRLIKPRILDVLFRHRERDFRIRDVAGILAKFGMDRNWIQIALQELLLRSRPLIWSEEGTQCEDLDSFARVALTPIGVGYYRSLFGEIAYDELCLYTESGVWPNLPDLYSFHQEITEIDLSQISQFASDHGTIEYYALFGEPVWGICHAHARRMLQGLRHRATKDPGIYDLNRLDWLEAKIKQLVPDEISLTQLRNLGSE